MHAPALPFPDDSPRDPRDDRTLRLASAIAATYLALTLLPMFGWAASHHAILPLLLHLAAFEVALLAASPTRRLPLVIREWAPLALGPFLYIELRWLIVGTGLPHHDTLVQGWERALLPGNPSATWAPAMPWVALSEWLHLSYASYYLLVLLPPVVLYARRRRQAFTRTVLALTLVYALCFMAYVVFPVDGPRFLVGPAAAPEGPIRGFVLHLLAAGSSRGTAFPSSHVAASVVATLCALQHARRLGIGLAIMTTGLTLATVYGGFHYGVDALAGLLVGIGSWALSIALWRRMSRAEAYVAPGGQRATAA